MEPLGSVVAGPTTRRSCREHEQSGMEHKMAVVWLDDSGQLRAPVALTPVLSCS
jgi:hypothetical protein